MHVAINATEIGRQRGGNESYLLGLLQGLAELEGLPAVTLLLTSAGRAALGGDVGRFAVADVGPYRRLPFYLWQQTLVLRRLRPNWYLSTFFLPPVTPCRAAVLVHDLSFRAHPEYFPRHVAFYMRLLTGAAIRQAGRIVALSDFTRRELQRFYPAQVGKAVVIHPGVDRAFRPQGGADDRAALRAYGLQPGYILALGNIHPRKNMARLLAAYERLRRQRSSAPPMVWAGLPRWESGALLERARAAGVRLPGFIGQADLPALYRQAVLLVYPSLYEGFGLPPLEAMACGTPVVASAATSLPEAVGDAALLVDPTDVEGIAAAIARLLDDPPLRERLREAGLARAALFTWPRTARALLSTLAP